LLQRGGDIAAEPVHVVDNFVAVALLVSSLFLF
jgi:hypothetical protein